MTGRIRDFRRRASTAGLLLSTARGLLRAVPVVAGAFAAAALLDHFFGLPAAVRQALWMAGVGGGTAALVSGFLPLSLFGAGAQARALAARSGGRFREDDLRIAAELETGRGGGSAELRDAFVRDVAARLDAVTAADCYPPQPWSRLSLRAAIAAALAVAFALLPGMRESLARALNPFVSSSVERLVHVTPGDARVPEGSDVDVTLEPLGDRSAAPELLLKTPSGWDVATPQSDGRVRVYRLRNVLQPIAYRVRLKGETSRRFDIVPVARLRVTAVTVKITPPAYTGLAPQTVTSPEIAALSGSEAAVSVEVSADVASAVTLFSDGREKPATLESARRLAVTFPVTSSGTYRFRVIDAKGDATETEPYPISATADAAPEIRLLSPTESIAIGEREKLPLTFDVRDDVALAEVRVEWEGNRGKGALTAVRFREKRDGGILTYDWDLAAAGFQPGDRLRYRLAAVDANVVTGPGIGRTDWLGLEVASFEREHEAVEQALGAWRDKTVDLLAQLSTLKGKLDKGADKPETLAGEFNQSAQLSQKLDEALAAIVNKMEQDPLADIGVLTEHQAMSESFKAVNRTMVPAARGALNTGNKEAAAATLEQMSSELERMTALSEDLTKRQNARDAVDRGDALEKLGQDLLEKLDNADTKDPALAAQVQKILQEAAKNLQELARTLQKNPGELPEDFVNQQALKNMKIGTAQDMLQKIADAVKAGDAKGAMAMAQQFLKMTQDFRKRLNDANDGFTNSGSMSDLEKKISEQQKKLEETVQKQRDVLAGTQELDGKRVQRTLKEQDGAFQKLAQRQRAVIGTLRETLPTVAATPVGGRLASLTGPMLEILGELEKRSLVRSFDILPVVAGALSAIATEVQPVNGAAAASVSGMASEEQAILDELRALREARAPVPSEEKPRYETLRKSQDDLAKQTQDLRQQFQALSRKTATLGLPLTEALNRAAGEMKTAGGRLGDVDSRAALASEQSALSALQDASDALSQAQESMSQMSGGGQGSGGAPRIIARPSGAGGQKGSKSSPVRFPKAEDYRPPREFREDLMESLKENYPKIYEDIIHRYYRRLAD